MNTMLKQLFHTCSVVNNGFEYVQPIFLLSVRCYVAWIFFKSGLVKIQSWSSTLMLFEYEYAVPVLSPYWGAVLGTAAELSLPVLLVLGLGGRLSIVALFVFNVVAVVSYADISPAGVQQHILWGFMLGTVFIYGMGRWSADHLLGTRLQKMTIGTA